MKKATSDNNKKNFGKREKGKAAKVVNKKVRGKVKEYRGQGR